MPKISVSESSESDLRQYRCNRCKAEPGALCVDRSGRRKLRSHRARHLAHARAARLAQRDVEGSAPVDLYAQYRLERSFPCEDCGAKPDEKCRGKRKPYLESTHASRQRQAGNKYVR